MKSCRVLHLLAISVILSGPLLAQNSAPPDADNPAATLHVNVRNVLVDVVITDKSGKPVTGLDKTDFQVFEDGKPQSVNFFERHPDIAPAVETAPAGPPLPPNTFTNLPAKAPIDSVNLLLMDSLNTPVADQAYVHKQMVKYLASIPPRIRIGVFLLSERLRIIQGFTQDSSVLRASIARLAANPQSSSLLPSPEAASADDTVIGLIMTQATAEGSSQLVDTALALQQFMDQESGYETQERITMTLDALQQIARYLSGVPGRKNLIWFVGAIPVCLAAMNSETELTNNGCPYEDKFKKTVNMLADARVSIYPIDAAGLRTDTIYDSGGPPAPTVIQGASTGNAGGNGVPPTPGVSPFSLFIGAQSTAFQTDTSNRATNQFGMDDLAVSTGGKAYYNGNGLLKALADDVENGSRYYTIAYSPSNHKEVPGKERKIEIKTASGNYKLEYRRSYYEQTKREMKTAEAAPEDPLRPLMDRGMPDFSELHYRMKVAPSSQQPSAGTAPAGDNAAVKAPLTRYTVNFSLATDGLALNPAPDGVRRGTIEVALVAYSQDGKPLNWEARSINLAVRPEQVAFAQTSGIPFHFDIDAPPGDVYLRTGIYDASTSKAGTLEIPLSAVKLPAN